MPSNIASLNTRTIYGARLQNSQHLKTDFQLMPHSTLNEKFNILPNINIGTEIPYLGYMCLGAGAGIHHTLGDGTNVIGLCQHSVDDAALYKHVPWVVRPLNNDVDIVTRNKLGLREIKIHNSEPYVYYWLKRIDFTNITSKAYLNVPNTPKTEFIPIPANLSPIRPNILPSGAIPVSGNYLNTSTIVRVELSPDDINEYLNAWEFIYGSTVGCCITEMGLCSGLDKITSAQDSNNNSFNFTEAVAVQVCHHLVLNQSFINASSSVAYELDLGSTEPLFL